MLISSTGLGAVFIRHQRHQSKWPALLFFKNSLQFLHVNRSNDYSQNDCKSNLKAILLNKVVVGKGHKMTHDNSTITSPPQGYDSVSLTSDILYLQLDTKP